MSEQGQQADPELSAVMSERRQLINLAYRLLGSLADAEDAVQETYARWYGMTPGQRDAIASPGAWLTRVASRVCLDQLRSARVRRERYVGAWLPEPLPDGFAEPAQPVDPADRVTLDESVSMAFLVVLDSMTPAERVAFVLHDVFRYPFAEVADIVGRTPVACRRLASSARRRLGTVRAPEVPAEQHRRVVREFRRAWLAKDIAALIELLDPDVTATADGGGLATARLHPVRGSEQVARGFVALAERAGSVAGLELEEGTVNGQPGLVGRQHGVTVVVLAFHIVNNRIGNIWSMRNPEKLRAWT